MPPGHLRSKYPVRRSRSEAFSVSSPRSFVLQFSSFASLRTGRTGSHITHPDKSGLLLQTSLRGGCNKRATQTIKTLRLPPFEKRSGPADRDFRVGFPPIIFLTMTDWLSRSGTQCLPVSSSRSFAKRTSRRSRSEP